MAAKKHAVDGDQFLRISGKLFEIERQARLGLNGKNRSPFDPHILDKTLQMVVEGRWWAESNADFRKWPISYQIDIGDPRSDIVADLTSFGCELTEGELNVINQISFNPCCLPQTLNLVVATATDLGIDEGTDATYRRICSQALSLGLGLCPREIGPLLRLEIADQPAGWEHVLRIAMNPMYRTDVPNKWPKVFCLAGGKPPLLRLEEGDLLNRCYVHSAKWVFTCHDALALHQ